MTAQAMIGVCVDTLRSNQSVAQLEECTSFVFVFGRACTFLLFFDHCFAFFCTGTNESVCFRFVAFLWKGQLNNRTTMTFANLKTFLKSTFNLSVVVSFPHFMSFPLVGTGVM